uniref:Dipeptidyl-peptidase III n=1 Tax=Trepomonas sp. PC1 TaxID=1076344 RepID=A0A146K414_9EUKA|eukprot:JAP91643.1 Dipeptidyl-peptidase III [Trepomonas sp. PC1]
MRMVEILSISLHELFGHGSKAFVFQNQFEKLTTQQQNELKTYYKQNSDVRLNLGDMRNFLEECRAEATTYCLQFDERFISLLQIDDHEAWMAATLCNTVIYCLAPPTNVRHKDTYSVARMTIFQHCIEPIGLINESGLLKFDHQTYQKLSQNLKNFLYKINLLMLGGNYEGAKELFGDMQGKLELQFKKYLNFYVQFRNSKQFMQKEKFEQQKTYLLKDGCLLETQGQTLDEVYTMIQNVELAMQ